MEFAEFDLKCIHMAQYALILKQEEAIWLRIICKPLPTLKRATENQKYLKEFQNQFSKISNFHDKMFRTFRMSSY